MGSQLPCLADTRTALWRGPRGRELKAPVRGQPGGGTRQRPSARARTTPPRPPGSPTRGHREIMFAVSSHWVWGASCHAAADNGYTFLFVPSYHSRLRTARECCLIPPLTDERTEEGRTRVTCPRSPGCSQWVLFSFQGSCLYRRFSAGLGSGSPGLWSSSPF